MKPAMRRVMRRVYTVDLQRQAQFTKAGTIFDLDEEQLVVVFNCFQHHAS
jgi:hypothetical protein